ncbi:MAG: LysO family transporter [Bacteroidales bacterium]
MYEIIILLAVGIVIGWLIRKKQKLVSITDRSLGWSVYLLLFLLGIGIGTNEEIIREFSKLGLQAAGISLLAIAGSIGGAVVCYRLFFEKK